MFEIIKDKKRQTIPNRQALAVYLANGWTLLKTKEEPIVKDVPKPLDELTKKELQSRLELKGIEYDTRDSKSALIEKLNGGTPADNFDDGLLKG